VEYTENGNSISKAFGFKFFVDNRYDDDGVTKAFWTKPSTYMKHAQRIAIVSVMMLLLITGLIFRILDTSFQVDNGIAVFSKRRDVLPYFEH